jgi:hypothetical protein
MQARWPGLTKTEFSSLQEEEHARTHKHGVINPELFSTYRGLYAVKSSKEGNYMQSSSMRK